MAPKKAAKKIAKKAAKKSPGQTLGQNTRRCYEHFGRVSALLPLLQGMDHERDTVVRTVSLAQDLLGDGRVKEAADLLRAAEHLSFGSLAMAAPVESVSPLLLGALRDEYHHLLERADGHAAELTGPVAKLVAIVRRLAVQAFKAERYRAASELARGAEALSHVTGEVAGRLRSRELQQLETR